MKKTAAKRKRSPVSGVNYLPLETPRFKSEAEEAAWWDKHPDAIEDLFRRGAKAGTITRGTVAKALQTKATTIRLFAQDLERAKAVAERKGLRYQTYLKMLIHEALPREEKAS